MSESQSLSSIRGQKPMLFYGYIIVIAGFCIQMVVLGIYRSMGIYYNSFIIDFGWARATMTTASSLASLMNGVSAIIIGRLSDKFGPRIVLTVCGVLFGVGCLMMSTINSLWQLYLLFGVITGIGVSAADITTLSTVARWFVKKRGMMSGILKVGTGIGNMAIPLLVTSLIIGYGWRQSFVILGVIALVGVILAAQFLKRDPAEIGLLPDGVAKVTESNTEPTKEGLSLKQAIHTRQFRMLIGAIVSFYFCMQTIMAHIVLNAIGLGITAASAATVLSVIGGVSIAGRLTMGVIVDKIGSRFWLQSATKISSLYVFAGIYGFSHGGFFALLSPLIAELFGLKSHGAILGAVIFGGAIGGAIGPVLAGWIFDMTQSYQIAFSICTAFSVAALVLALLLRNISIGKGSDLITS